MKIKKIGAVVQIFLILSLTFAFSLNSKDVNAVQGCCEKSRDGTFCDYVEQNECEGNFAPTSCDKTSFCGTGCCANVEGYCYDNYPKGLCLSPDVGGNYYSGTCGNVGECNLGCCLIGTDAAYVTKSKCIQETGKYPDLEVDFREEVQSEQACLDLAKTSVQGCCVTETGCEYGAKSTCSVQTTFNGTGFYEGKYCSQLPSRCACAPSNEDPENTGCLDNSDDVYYFDSCGNPEGVAEDCKYEDGNICGDLDNDGKFTCEDVNCKDKNKLSIGLADDKSGKISPNVQSRNEIRNGETWCLWDYNTEEDARNFYGKDPVGATHYRSLCINGQELVEPCADFRKEYCFSADLNVPGVENNFGSEDFLAARCLPNDKWQACVDECNTADPFTMTPEEYARALEKDKSCCSDIADKDCQWAGKCVPAVKPGYKFWESEGTDQCSKGNLECKSIFVCPGWDGITGNCDPANDAAAVGGWFLKFGIALVGGGAAVVTGPVGWAAFLGGVTGAGAPILLDEIIKAAEGGSNWHLVSGGECLSQNFLQSANNYCRSMGDCGADYNYLGEGLTYAGFANTETIDEEIERSLNELGEEEIIDRVKSAHDRAENKIDKKIIDQLKFKFTDTDRLEKKGIPGKFEEVPQWEAGKFFFDFTVTQGDDEDFTQRLFGLENDAAGWTRGLLTSAGFFAGGAIIGASTVGTATGVLAGLFTTPGLNVLATVPGFFSESLKFSSLFQKAATSNSVANIKDLSIDQLRSQVSPEAYEAAIENVGGIPNKQLILKEGPSALTTKGQEDLKKFLIEEATSVKNSQQTAKKVAEFSTAEFLQGVNAGMWVYTAYKVVDVVAEETKEVPITTTCTPWQAPPVTQEDQCEQCNPDYYVEDGTPQDVNALKKCTEYRCKSLGASCELINKGTDKETCVSLFRFDVNPPIIEPWEDGFTEGFEVERFERGVGFEVVNNDPENPDKPKIQVYNNFVIGLQTDKPSQCKMSFNKGIKFEDMPNTYFGSNLYEYYHVQTMFYPKSKEVNEETGEVKLTGGGTYELAVRCQDAAGNTNLNDYVIKFIVSDEPDLTPPSILGASVIVNNELTSENEVFVTSGETKVPVTLFVNEPSTCRFDFNNLNYNDMIQSCEARNVNNIGSYDCEFTGDPGKGPAVEIQESKAGVTKFVYFKCKDNENNFNKDPFRLTLKGSNNLTIEKISTDPGANADGEIKTSLSVLPVKLLVKTGEGAKLNGEATCKYTQQESLQNNLGAMIPFLTTSGSVHEQEFNSLSTGQHTFFVGCYDVAGNVDYDKISFSLIGDSGAPLIVRAYKDNSLAPASFNIELNEDADCKDSTEGTFDFETGGNPMTKDGNVHISASEPSNLYYVVCKDVFGNIMKPAKIQFA